MTRVTPGSHRPDHTAEDQAARVETEGVGEEVAEALVLVPMGVLLGVKFGQRQ